jgi:hypothetical protein
MPESKMLGSKNTVWHLRQAKKSVDRSQSDGRRSPVPRKESTALRLALKGVNAEVCVVHFN